MMKGRLILVAQIIVFIRSTAAYCPIPNSERLLQSTHGSITYNRTANESVYCIWYLPISPSLPAVVIQIDYINVLHSTSYCKKTYCEGAQYCQKDSIRIKRGIKGIPDFVICGKVAPSKCYIVCSNNITEQQCTKAKQLCRNKTAHYITSSETELYVDFAASSTSGFTLTYDVTDCMETTQSTIEVGTTSESPVSSPSSPTPLCGPSNGTKSSTILSASQPHANSRSNDAVLIILSTCLAVALLSLAVTSSMLWFKHKQFLAIQQTERHSSMKKAGEKDFKVEASRAANTEQYITPHQIATQPLKQTSGDDDGLYEAVGANQQTYIDLNENNP